MPGFGQGTGESGDDGGTPTAIYPNYGLVSKRSISTSHTQTVYDAVVADGTIDRPIIYDNSKLIYESSTSDILDDLNNFLSGGLSGYNPYGGTGTSQKLSDLSPLSAGTYNTRCNFIPDNPNIIVAPGSFVPGHYDCSATLDGPLFLSGGATDVFIVKVYGDLTILKEADLELGSINPANVYWDVSGNIIINEGANFSGIAHATGNITIQGAFTGLLALFAEGDIDLGPKSNSYWAPVNMAVVQPTTFQLCDTKVCASSSTLLPTVYHNQHIDTWTLTSGNQGSTTLTNPGGSDWYFNSASATNTLYTFEGQLAGCVGCPEVSLSITVVACNAPVGYMDLVALWSDGTAANPLKVSVTNDFTSPSGGCLSPFRTTGTDGVVYLITGNYYVDSDLHLSVSSGEVQYFGGNPTRNPYLFDFWANTNLQFNGLTQLSPTYQQFYANGTTSMYVGTDLGLLIHQGCRLFGSNNGFWGGIFSLPDSPAPSNPVAIKIILNGIPNEIAIEGSIYGIGSPNGPYDVNGDFGYANSNIIEVGPIDAKGVKFTNCTRGLFTGTGGIAGSSNPLIYRCTFNSGIIVPAGQTFSSSKSAWFVFTSPGSQVDIIENKTQSNGQLEPLEVSVVSNGSILNTYDNDFEGTDFGYSIFGGSYTTGSGNVGDKIVAGHQAIIASNNATVDLSKAILTAPEAIKIDGGTLKLNASKLNFSKYGINVTGQNLDLSSFSCNEFVPDGTITTAPVAALRIAPNGSLGTDIGGDGVGAHPSPDGNIWPVGNNSGTFTQTSNANGWNSPSNWYSVFNEGSSSVTLWPYSNEYYGNVYPLSGYGAVTPNQFSPKKYATTGTPPPTRNDVTQVCSTLLTNPFGPFRFAAPISSNNPTGIIEQSNETFIRDCFPNPAENYSVLNYHLPEEAQNAKIAIYEMASGRLVSEFELKKDLDKIEISTTGLKSGIYTLQLYVDGENSATKKLAVIK